MYILTIHVVETASPKSSCPTPPSKSSKSAGDQPTGSGAFKKYWRANAQMAPAIGSTKNAHSGSAFGSFATSLRGGALDLSVPARRRSAASLPVSASPAAGGGVFSPPACSITLGVRTVTKPRAGADERIAQPPGHSTSKPAPEKHAPVPSIARIQASTAHLRIIVVSQMFTGTALPAFGRAGLRRLYGGS